MLNGYFLMSYGELQITFQRYLLILVLINLTFSRVNKVKCFKMIITKNTPNQSVYIRLNQKILAPEEVLY